VLFYLTAPFLAFLLVVFQQGFLNLFFFQQLSVEVSLLLAIYAGFRMDLVRGAVLSVLMGFFIDCLTGAITGLYMTAYALVFLLSFLVSARVYVKQGTLIMAYVIACTLLEGLLVVGLTELIHGVALENRLRVFVLQALVLGALSPAVFPVFDRVRSFLQIDEP
jgi:rod shape-determining protein MreD